MNTPNDSILLHIWPFFCIAVMLLFVVLILRFLWNNGGKRKSDKQYTIVLVLLSTGLIMGGCEKNAPQIDKTVKVSNLASNIESNYFETHEFNESDFGKSIIKFETVEQANLYYAEAERALAGESTGETIPELARASVNAPLLSAWSKGDSLQYRTTRSTEPIQSTTNLSVCLFAYCTDYYLGSSGEYLGEVCTYGVAPCGGSSGNGSGSSNNGGSIPGGSGPSSGGSSGTTGGLRNGTGVVIAHTAYPRYTRWTNLEFQISLRNCSLTGVTGQLTGFNLGVNYIQGTPQVTSTGNNSITIMVPYNVSLNAVVQGIGTVRTIQGNVAEIRVNCRTGVATILI